MNINKEYMHKISSQIGVKDQNVDTNTPLECKFLTRLEDSGR